ncbi:MAG: hypothetical protein EXR99_08900 [Gemmataceae bacterium]|nr:hypothetical protein [Gemmataceae bacterium]
MKVSLAFTVTFLLACFLPPVEDLDWKEAKDLGLENQGFQNILAPYDRLPADLEKKARPPVWSLSRHSAGLASRFTTDASEIHAEWKLTSDRLAMPHMPATGVSGLDLYWKDAKGNWKWVANGRPLAQANQAKLASGLPRGKHEYLLYLPLYNGVKEVRLGVSKGALLAAAPPRPGHLQKPVVYYGTSIAQGGCASRPGMAHTNILHRMLDRPVVNLGFSGSGTLDPEIGEAMARIDAAAYVLDCLPNMQPEAITARLEPFVIALRKARPKTPILLVEDRTLSNAAVIEGAKRTNEGKRKAHGEAMKRLQDRGITGLFFQPGEPLLGNDGESTVDGSHPTDLGFLRYAEALAPTLKPMLEKAPAPRPVVEGYTSKISYAPGEKVSFRISCSAKMFDLEIARLGAKREVVFTQGGLAGKEFPIPDNASSHGCGWGEAFALDIPANWKSGYYSVTLKANSMEGKEQRAELFFILRSANPGKNSKILLQLSSNTYNAYCNWGGYSLYAYNGLFKVQGRRVSFERPILGQFRSWEQHFVQWAESAGYEIDYAANNDLEFHPAMLQHYKLVLSVGHDEYWSTPMRDHLEKFISNGGNVAFFSGNTCCWQVRNEETGQALACFKQAFRDDPQFENGDHRLLSTLWSHHLVKRPENSLTGVGFLWGGYHRSHGQYMDGSGAFTIHRPDHWILQGAKVKKGDAFGGKQTIVGYECDGCQLLWKNDLPFPTGLDGTPAEFTILATAPARWHPDDCEWYDRWQKGREGHAVLGLYTRNGTVVTVGSTDWSHGLAGNDPVTVRVTKNILDRLGK